MNNRKYSKKIIHFGNLPDDLNEETPSVIKFRNSIMKEKNIINNNNFSKEIKDFSFQENNSLIKENNSNNNVKEIKNVWKSNIIHNNINNKDSKKINILSHE